MGTKTIWLPAFFKIYIFGFHRGKEVIWVYKKRYVGNQTVSILIDFHCMGGGGGGGTMEVNGT